MAKFAVCSDWINVFVHIKSILNYFSLKGSEFFCMGEYQFQIILTVTPELRDRFVDKSHLLEL